MEGGRRPGRSLKTGSHRRARGRGAQATLEFAVVAPLFFVCFFAVIDAALWAVQNSSEVAAVESAARVAASSGTQPLAQTAPDARTVAATVSARLQQTLFATRIVPWCTGDHGACGASGCPRTPADVEARYGPRVVALCVSEDDTSACAGAAPGCVDTPIVTVRLVGFVAALVPPGFGVGEVGGELPTDVATTTHSLRFAP